MARWILWLAALVVLTFALLPARAHIDRTYIVLGFLLVVLGGTATGGRALGLVLAALAYLSFHYFFVEHYESLVLSRPMDVFVLVAFLVTTVIAEQLLSRAQSRERDARLRAEEVERLATLGAESLHAGRTEDALDRILDVIRAELHVERCEILPPGERPAAGDARERLIPLSVRGESIGFLRLVSRTPIAFTREQERFLSALSYYAALGVERVRLVADAERAEAFRQADALKAELISSLSHDLRTPLTTIKGLASRLASAALPEATSIEEEADRLNRLVTDLLDLSRLNARAMPVHAELNTVEDLVGAAIKPFIATPQGSRIAIVTPRDETSGMLAGNFDFVLSLRALVNLIENALKYSPGGAPVEIGARRVGDQVEISVADRGPGIAEADRPHVFTPFYRGQHVASPVGGAGLGLAIARRLAEVQHGDVTLHQRPDGGSVFALRLPAADVQVVPET